MKIIIQVKKMKERRHLMAEENRMLEEERELNTMQKSVAEAAREIWKKQKDKEKLKKQE